MGFIGIPPGANIAVHIGKAAEHIGLIFLCGNNMNVHLDITHKLFVFLKSYPSTSQAKIFKARRNSFKPLLYDVPDYKKQGEEIDDPVHFLPTSGGQFNQGVRDKSE